jgi:hypothetical protein
LQTLGRYGDEPLFYPLSNMFFAVTRIIIWIFLLSGLQKSVYYPIWLLDVRVLILGLLFVLLGYSQTPVLRTMKRYFPKQAAKLLHFLAYYPAWYRELFGRTSRYERRRIAYMWLRLSSATRSGFDNHTPSFLQWTDLIIMGAVMEEDEPLPSQVPMVSTVLR